MIRDSRVAFLTWVIFIDYEMLISYFANYKQRLENTEQLNNPAFGMKIRTRIPRRGSPEHYLLLILKISPCTL